MTTNVATIQATVTANTAPLLAGLAASDAAVTQSAGGLAGLTKSAAAVMPGAMIAVGAIAAVGFAAYKAVSAAGDFQTQMTQLVTGAGLDPNSYNKVSQAILKMSADTGTSTTQLTAGMYMISSAGYSASQGLQILQASAEGAKVGAADLGTVANATTTIMTDFKGQNVSATQAVNALVATVANGKTHMEDLAASLSTVAPAASASNIKLTDMLGALATMTGEGVDAASAATYLRQTVISLNAPADTAKKALAAIGLTSEQVGDAMRVSLPGALQLIQDHLTATYQVGSPQYVAALKDIAGGQRQMQGMLDLTGSHLAQFGKDVSNITGAVQGGGDAITGWSRIQGTFQQQLDKVGASLGVLAITVGSQLIPPLTKVAAALAPIIAGFTSWLAGILSNQQTMQHLMPVLIIAAGVIGGVLVAALVAMAAAAWAALVPFLVFAAPFIAVGVAVAALAAGFIWLYNNVTWFRNLVQLLVSGAMVAFHDTFTLAGNLLGWVGDHFGGLSGIVASFRAGFEIDIRAAGDILGWLGDRFDQVAGFISKAFTDITTGAKAGINGVIGVINAMIKAIDSVHINLPKIGDFGGGNIGFNIPLLPQLAAGGLVSSGGLALVGEQGPEVVMLPGGASVLPNPQSQQVMNGSQGSQTIIIQLDGRTIAQNTIKHAPSIVRLATGARSF